MINEKKLYSISQAAELIGVSADTLRRWEEEGLYKPVRTSGGQRRYEVSTLKKLRPLTRRFRGRKNLPTKDEVQLLTPRPIYLNRKYLTFSLALAVWILAFGIAFAQTSVGKKFFSETGSLVKSLFNSEEAMRRIAKEEIGWEQNKKLGKILGDESLQVASNQLPVASYSPNLLKNSSFETKGTVESLAFWQLHPNSTNGNTQMSNHTSHSGSYSLLLSDKDCNGEVSQTSPSLRNCVLGVIQESTKTEANRNYTLGVWMKANKGPALREQQGRALSDTRIHLALGPGWDKSFPIVSDGSWHWYSTSFSSPPPGLTPRIYIEGRRNENQEIFVFLDDAIFVETESIADNQIRPGLLSEGRAFTNYLASASSFQTLLPAGGNVMSVSAQGIIYPTDSTQTQGGIGTESSRIGKVWGSNIDISQSLSVNEKVDISGKLTANGNVTLGNNDGDEIEVGGRFISDLLPKQSNAVSIGTSTQRWNNLFAAAANLSNNLTVGGTATITGMLTVNGGLTASGGSGLAVTGDLTLDGDLDFQGPQNITTTSDNLTISPTGNLIVDTSGGTVSIRDSAIDLTNQPTVLSANTLTLRSTGSFIIDTSVNNTDLRMQGGLGELRGDYGTIVLAAKQSLTLDSSTNNTNIFLLPGTGRIGVGTTNPATSFHISATDGLIIPVGTTLQRAGTPTTGTIRYNSQTSQFEGYSDSSWGSLGGVIDVDQDTYISAETSAGADNDDLKFTTAGTQRMIIDETGNVGIGTASPLFTLDVSGGTNILGNAGILLRAGSSTPTLSSGTTSTTSDIQLAAADQIDLSAGNFSLMTSNGSNGQIKIDSAGTFTLSTSRNNTNIFLLPGTGRIGIGTTNPLTAFHISATDGLIIPVGSTAQRAGTPTTGTIRYNSQTSQFEGYSDSSWGSLGGVIDVDQDTYVSAETSAGADNDDLKFTTAGTQRMIIDETGNIGIGPGPGSGTPAGLLDVIGNAPIILRAGQSSLDNSTSGSTSTTADLQLSAADHILAVAGSLTFLASNDSSYPLLLRSSQGGIQLSSQSLDNGSILISSTGNLYLDTSFYGTTTYIQGGLVRVGSGGTANNASGSGSLYVQSNLEVDGNVYLGDTTSDDLTLTGQIASNLIPNVGSSYDLGSTTNRWSEAFFDTLTVTTLNSSANNITGITSNSFTIDTSNTTVDTQDISITFERGTPATNSQFLWDASEKYFSLNAAFNISPDTDITTLSGENAILNVNDSYGGRRIATFSEKGTPRAVIDSSGNILLYQGSNIETSAGTLTLRGYSGLTLTTSSATTGEIRVLSRGTLQLDTSANNDNILLRAGTGNINLSATQARLTGNLIVTGTETFNGIAYTFPGADGSSSNVLTTSGAGLLSWGTLGAASITADSLDFAQFDDSLDLDADTSINGPYSFIIRAGQGSIENSTSGNNDLQLSATDKLILAGASFDLSTSSGAVDIISGSYLDLSSKGTLTLDTSQNNTNIVLTPGTGNIGIGSTAPVYKLDVNGTLRTTSTARIEGALTVTTGGASVTGDLTLDGDLDFTGAQNITTTADNLTLSPTGNLIIDTSGGTVSIRDAGIDLTNQPTTISGSTLTLRSTGTFIIDTSINNTDLRFQGGLGELRGDYGTVILAAKNSLTLDTSQNNTNIRLTAGTGNVNVSSNQLYLTGNLVVTGTETFNGIAYTFPGTDGSASNVLTTSGAGLLSWGTLGAASITADSLDFSEFKDEMTLDADTSINGDYSLIVRAGLGAIQNSTSGSNDLQLSAEDKLILGAASFDLLTSSGGIDMISGSYMDLSSKGTLTLDTSANNTNIVLTPGTGNIGIGSTAPVYKLDVNGTLRTTSTARIEGALTISTGGTAITGNSSITGDLTLDGDLDFTGAQNITTTADNLTISPTGNLIIDTSGGTVYVRDAWEVSQTSQFSGDLTLAGNANQITANNDFILTSAGTLTLDSSTNNTNIALQAGSGNINLSSTGTITLTGNTSLNNGTLRLNGLTYTFPGTDTANGVLISNGSGLLSWNTIGAANVTADSLDFSEFKDSMNLDADTSINGPYSFIIRAGQGSIENSASGNNDLQLAAADKLILAGASFDLSTSSGAVDIISGSYLDLSSKGTLTLDTSANNSNILMKTGSGNINVSTGTLTVTGLIDIRDSTGTLALATDSNGNVGIGTTSPLAMLHVAGECVTGDTVLRRKRKKAKGRRTKDEGDEDDFEDVPIKDIKEGDEVLTLDEQTGHFVWQKVNKLMDKGIKSIVKLTTASGKTIRTTAEHPYLTLADAKQAFAFIDEVGVGKAPDQPLFGVAAFYTNDSLSLNRKLHDIFTGAVSAYNTNESRFEFKFNAVTKDNLRFFRAIVKALAEDDSWSFAAAMTKKEKNWNYWDSYLEILPKLIAKAPFAKLTVVSDYLAKPKTAEKDLEAVTGLDKVSNLLQLESQGSLLLQVADILLGALHFEERRKELGLTGGKEAKVKLAKLVKALLAKKITAIECLHAVGDNLSRLLPAVNPFDKLRVDGEHGRTIKRQKWLKVKELAEGAVIATVDGWERISKIEKLQAEQVYDIEVEATHNFVGNGIVAHNTTGILMRAGASSLQLSSSATSTTADIELAAADRIDLFASTFSLSTSSLSAGELKLTSKGSLILDTSGAAGGGAPIALQAGSGNINLSSTGTITLTGNTSLNNGTLRLNGLTYTFPGADTANGVLISNGSGVLSWNTIGAANVTADSLDFTEFKDEMTLDADTSINGDYSLIVRSGLGAIQNSTSGSNDLQLSAEDKLILAGASFDLSTSSGAIDVISSQRLDLSAGGTLTLDTSANNTNIVLTPGTGNIGIGSTAPVYKLDVNGTLRTTSTARIEGALTVTTGGASVTGDLTLDGDLDFTGPQNITTTTDNLTLSPTGNLIIDTSGGTVSIRDAAIDLTAQPTTVSANTLTLRSTGTFILDTSANNTNLVLQGGTGGLTGSFGTVNLTAVTDSVSSLYLNSQRGGIQLSSSSASGNGDVRILSAGTLQLDTSVKNTNIRLSAGSGNVQVSSTQLYLTGNLVVTGTETFNGVTYTFPGADGSAGNVLTTSGAGILSWGTLGAGSITADSLDFAQFDDSLDLDADTSINGPYSFIIRAGQGSIENSTSGNNDLQLVAADKLILAGASFDLSTSSGGVDIISAGRIDLSAKGNLTLDTSQNNTNILLLTGTGNVGVGTTSPQGILDILGQCVARGTMIKRRKKRRGRKHGWDFEDVPVEEIEAGDEILTLDERTGKFVCQKVEKTMDKGIQTVFELVTESGKRVEATKEHPYLTVEDNKKALVSQSSFDSNSPHGEYRTCLNDMLANIKLLVNPLWTGGELNPRSRNDKSISPTRVRPTNSFYQTLSWRKVSFLKPGMLIATIDGWERIVAIKNTGRRQVYDLEIEATHNFVGNGIVAHNTTGILMRAGASSLQLSSSATSTTADIELAAADRIDLFASSMALSTSSATAGSLQLTSKGSLILDTSGAAGGGAPIALQAGSGNINLSSTGTITLTGNTSLNNGTLRLNGLTYTFPGTDTANGVLISNGSGLLSWNTIGAANVTADSLDFTEFKDSMTLDADTSINGPYSFIIRAGQGSIQNSTSGSNDLQLSAEDKLILAGASFDLSTSSGAVDIISNQRLDLSSGGTLTLDTSANNTNIVMTPGTGNIGIGSTAPVYKLDINGTLRTTSTARIEGALTVTTGGASVTGDLALDGDLDFTGPQNITTTADNLTLSPTGNLIIDTSGGTLSIRDAAIDLTNQPTTISGSTLTLRSTGNFILDTSINNTNIALQAGSGNINLSSTGTITLTGNTSLNNGTLRLNGLTYTFPGADTANGVLISNGSGLLSWNTIGASNVTADSLDFTEFKDSMNLDADTSINGPYSFIIRAGNAARQNATSGSNDLQLSAEDQLLLDAGRMTLSTSSTTEGELKLVSKGTLQLDTSANNTNVLVNIGSGNMNIDAGTLFIAGGNDRVGIGTTSPSTLLHVRGAVTGQTLVNFDEIGDQDILTASKSGTPRLTITRDGNIKLHQTSTIYTIAGDLQLQTSSARNDNIVIRTYDSAASTANGDDIFIAAQDNLYLGASALTLETTSGSAGQLVIRSDGTLQLDTSANNTNILLLPGTGNVGIGTSAPGGILDVKGDASIILRAGLGAVQNSTSGDNDIQLAAEDRLDLFATSYSLTTSGNSVDILSGGRIDLSAKGNLTLDTSQNNTDLQLSTGTGKILSLTADSSTAVGFRLDTKNSLSTQGSKLLALSNAGTEKMYIDKDGNLYIAGTLLSGNGSGQLMTNKSGGTVANRSLVIIDTSNNSSFTTTTTAYSKLAYGVVTGVGLGVTNDANGDGVCNANDICMVAQGGEVEVLLTNASTATKGDYIFTGTTAGSGVSSAKQFDGLVGVVTSTAGAGSGYVKMIFKVQPQVTAAASIDKGSKHNEYQLYADKYNAVGEGSDTNNNLLNRGMAFDNLSDSTKTDSANTTVSGPAQFSSVIASEARQSIPAAPYRAGLMGGQTMSTATTDNAGNTYLGSNTVNKTFLYDRTRDSTPQVQAELGIDPNWYNGVTLAIDTSSGTASQNSVITKPNPNLSTTYNGSLVKAAGTIASNDGAINLVVKAVSGSTISFSWDTVGTTYTGRSTDSATFGTATSLLAQNGTDTGVDVTFTSSTKYNTGDVFKIASWFVEPAGSTRGGTAKFPERSTIIATASSVDIIDADTQKLWMRFSQGTSYAIGVDANNDPNSVNMLNGKMYVAANGSSATGLYGLDFVHDAAFKQNATDWRLSDSNLSQRNGTNTYNVLNTSNILVNITANDVAAAVIPNQPTQEVTVSGWGYIQGVASATTTETVNLPYKFNSPPVVVISGNGGLGSSVVPTSLSSCSNTYSVHFNAGKENVTTSTFVARIFSSDASTQLYTSSYYCYTWTATGQVSPRQYVAAATNGGTTVINETDQSAINVTFDSYNSMNRVFLTSKGDLYYNANNGSTERDFVLDLHGIGGRTSSLNNTYEIEYYAGGAGKPSLVGVVSDQLNSLYVTEGTSTIDGKSNTIYIGTDGGLSVIQEKQSGITVPKSSNGTDETNGSVKYYTKDYISEEMVGDIRDVHAFNGSGALAANTTLGALDSDISVKANAWTTVASSPTRVTGVRGQGLSFASASSQKLCTGTTGSCANDTDLAITGNLTVGAWIKTSSNGAIISKMNTAGTAGWALDTLTTGAELYIYGGTSSKRVSNQIVQDGIWHFVVGVYNASSASINIYIDGQNQSGTTTGTIPSSITDSTEAAAIGWGGGGFAYFNGSIDEPFVTATALTAGQIKHMYEVGYRALQSHATTLGGGGTDLNQQLGFISTGTNTVGAVAPDYNNQFMYVGSNSTTLGAVSKIDLNSDTNIKTYNSTANVPAGGALLIDEDTKSLAVGYNLEAVGSAASGVKTMGVDNSSTSLTGNFIGKTVTTAESFTQAYLWAQYTLDSSDASNTVTVSASNDGGSNYYQCNLTNTDASQSPTEYEYFCQFNAAGSSLKTKFALARGSTKTNTYVTRYGIAWIGSDAIGGAPGGNGLYTNNNSSVANGSYIDVAHNQNSNDVVTNGWVYNTGTSKWEVVDNTQTDATGGTITTSGGYTIHTFTSSGTFTPPNAGNVEYLVVGGGGGGGWAPGAGYQAGGGGAGGMRTATGFAVTAQAYTVTVGGGGAGGTADAGASGSDSVFSTITSTGGGGGGRGLFGATTAATNGSNGGSGGGGGGSQSGTTPTGGTGTAGQGTDGGAGSSDNSGKGGSGGGAGGAGNPASSVGNNTTDVAGGIGTSSSISGSAVTYSTGGVGQAATLANGAANTGNGGTGGRHTSVNGGNGGSGIVIVRYLTNSLSAFKITQQDANTVRLYNYSGAAQNLRLDVITGGLGRNAGTVSLAPAAADVDAQDSVNSIWVNKTGSGGNILRLQAGGADKFVVTQGGNVGIGVGSPGYTLDVSGGAQIAGNSSIVLRAGQAAINASVSGSTSTTADIQIAAADRLDLYATSYSLTTSGNSVDIFSGGRIDLSAKGNLTLDTSQNNGNIILLPGSGTVQNSGVYTATANTNLRLQASGTDTGSTGTGSIYFLNSSGIAAGRFETNTSINATGGTITTSGIYTIHTFTSSGTFTPGIAGNVDYLVVAGGGGGGDGTLAASFGGGGGAGGYKTATGFAVTATGYTVTVGTAGTAAPDGGATAGGDGGNSVFGSITSTGGGGGGSTAGAGSIKDGRNGGSGGGVAWAGTTAGTGIAGQGFAGSTYNSGGGGGGGGGSSATSTTGAGGVGTASSISGASVTYATGGGSGVNGASTANSGNGGNSENTGRNAQAGGSGIVIVRYLTYGTLYLGATNTSSADLAEYYITGDKSIESGDVVAISNYDLRFMNYESDKEEVATTKGVLRKAEKAYDQKLIGIISTNPGVLMGSIDGDTDKADKRMLALSGRVPVKIDPDSPPIEVGDFLTSSDKPGLARKATKAGYTVGKALEGWSCNSENSENSDSQISSENQTIRNSDTPTFRSSESSECSEKIEAFVNLGYYIGPLTADGYIDTQQKFIAGDVKVDLRAETYKRLMAELNLPIDSTGSLRNAPQLTEVSQTYDPSLAPDTVSASVAEVLSALAGKTENNEQRITQLEELAALLAGTNTLSTSSDSLIINHKSPTISGSYMDNELAIKTATDLTISHSGLDPESIDIDSRFRGNDIVRWNDNGLQILGSATVGGSLTVGLVTIDDLNASINSMGETLKLQNLGLAAIEFMGGKVVITKNGDMEIQGNLDVAGNITSQGAVEAEEFKVLGTKSAGSAVLRAGTLTLSVSTEAVGPESRVLLTPTSKTEAVIAVTEKVFGRFTVEIALPQPEDISFDWFIIGN